MLRNCLLSIGLSLLCLLSFGQNNQKMNVWQDSLEGLGKKIFGKLAETERVESNFSFVKTLVSALKEPNSFYFTFDKLSMISILNAPDNAFRIFTWNLPLQDGSYLYYGTIQYKSGTIKLTPLLDKTFQIANPEQDILPAKEWYGAQYYDIIPLSKERYVLLGWKGHHADYSKRVIEVLHVSTKGEVTFGGNIFSDDTKLARKIFSYTRQATMYLKYNTANKQIEFDHMVPAAPSLKGNYKYYGPDLSYDGYVLDQGKLVFKENIEIQNPVREDDDRYIDPRKPNKKLKSGLQ